MFFFSILRSKLSISQKRGKRQKGTMHQNKLKMRENLLTSQVLKWERLLSVSLQRPVVIFILDMPRYSIILHCYPWVLLFSFGSNPFLVNFLWRQPSMDIFPNIGQLFTKKSLKKMYIRRNTLGAVHKLCRLGRLLGRG